MVTYAFPDPHSVASFSVLKLAVLTPQMPAKLIWIEHHCASYLTSLSPNILAGMSPSYSRENKTQRG